MDRREELAAAADDDQRRRKLWIGCERETPFRIRARGAVLVDDGDLRAGDGPASGIQKTRFKRKGIESKDEEKKRDEVQRGPVTTLDTDTTAGKLAGSRGMTSVSIAVRMCFAMRWM